MFDTVNLQKICKKLLGICSFKNYAFSFYKKYSTNKKLSIYKKTIFLKNHLQIEPFSSVEIHMNSYFDFFNLWAMAYVFITL